MADDRQATLEKIRAEMAATRQRLAAMKEAKAQENGGSTSSPAFAKASSDDGVVRRTSAQPSVLSSRKELGSEPRAVSDSSAATTKATSSSSAFSAGLSRFNSPSSSASSPASTISATSSSSPLPQTTTGSQSSALSAFMSGRFGGGPTSTATSKPATASTESHSLGSRSSALAAFSSGRFAGPSTTNCTTSSAVAPAPATIHQSSTVTTASTSSTASTPTLGTSAPLSASTAETGAMTQREEANPHTGSNVGELNLPAATDVEFGANSTTDLPLAEAVEDSTHTSVASQSTVVSSTVGNNKTASAPPTSAPHSASLGGSSGSTSDASDRLMKLKAVTAPNTGVNKPSSALDAFKQAKLQTVSGSSGNKSSALDAFKQARQNLPSRTPSAVSSMKSAESSDTSTKPAKMERTDSGNLGKSSGWKRLPEHDRGRTVSIDKGRGASVDTMGSLSSTSGSKGGFGTGKFAAPPAQRPGQSARVAPAAGRGRGKGPSGKNIRSLADLQAAIRKADRVKQEVQTKSKIEDLRRQREQRQAKKKLTREEKRAIRASRRMTIEMKNNEAKGKVENKIGQFMNMMTMLETEWAKGEDQRQQRELELQAEREKLTKLAEQFQVLSAYLAETSAKMDHLKNVLDKSVESAPKKVRNEQWFSGLESYQQSFWQVRHDLYVQVAKQNKAAKKLSENFGHPVSSSEQSTSPAGPPPPPSMGNLSVPSAPKMPAAPSNPGQYVAQANPVTALLSQIRQGTNLKKLTPEDIKREKESRKANWRKSVAILTDLQDVLKSALDERQLAMMDSDSDSDSDEDWEEDWEEGEEGEAAS